MERLRHHLLSALLLAGLGFSVPQATLASNAVPGGRLDFLGGLERGDGRFAMPAQSIRLAMAISRSSGRANGTDRYGEFLGELNGPESRLFADAADGRLDEHTLLQAALVASGVADEAELNRYDGLFFALESELKQTEKLYGSPRQQAEAVFEFLHRRVLQRGYRLEGTDLRTAIEEGWFNCVSATVLYNCLAASCGLSTSALEAPGHAMSRVLLPEGPIDVETTCPRWFKLIDDPKRQAEHVMKTLGRASSRDLSQMHEASPIQVAAMIYYNRGVDLLGAKRFAEAAAANAKALQLDPQSKTARGNLLATINNWAIAEGASRHYAAALDLLRRGRAIEPNFEVFRLNYSHVCRQWALDLCAAGQYNNAVDVLRDALPSGPDPAPIREAIAETYRKWTQTLGQNGESVQVLAVLQEAKADLGPTPELLAAETAELSRLANSAAENPKVESRLVEETEPVLHEEAIFDRPRRGSHRGVVSKTPTNPRAAPE